jgi:oxygen-independent coproporphyrinogen III oxidase
MHYKASFQAVVYSGEMDPCSVYIHIPFCAHRCGYCDFNTYAGLESLIPVYIRALCREISHTKLSCAERLTAHTIFYGGGTPSLLPIRQLDQVLNAISDTFNLDRHVEITLEANPGTISQQYLVELKRLGFTRLSLGVQSAHPDELNLLERAHDYPTVTRAVSWARKAGFENLNMDLIFGLPGQQLETWQRNLELVLGLRPEHLSLYALTIEEDTPFGRWTRRGLIPSADPDLAADLYEWASDFLAYKGFAQYEISNWALDPEAARVNTTTSPVHACRHNLQYWRNLPYLGFGAGAHGYCAGYRTANVLTPVEYIQKLAEPVVISGDFPITPATLDFHSINLETEIGETMMTGLRLVREGVSDRRFQERFQRSLVEVFPDQITHFTGLGLLEWASNYDDRHLRLSARGRLLGNQVFAEFI